MTLMYMSNTAKPPNVVEKGGMELPRALYIYKYLLRRDKFRKRKTCHISPHCDGSRGPQKHTQFFSRRFRPQFSAGAAFLRWLTRRLVPQARDFQTGKTLA